MRKLLIMLCAVLCWQVLLAEDYQFGNVNLVVK